MPHLAPQTLIRAEQEALLLASRCHPRDHLIFSMALGTGLRLAEIVGLNVGDVFFPDGTPRGRISLRREIAKGGRTADVFLPDALGPKLERFWRYKRRAGEGLDSDAPLLCNQSGDRISKRRVQVIFRRWQERAGFDRLGSLSVGRVLPRAVAPATRAGPKPERPHSIQGSETGLRDPSRSA
jgi:integrase/recombinase XerC